MLSIYFPHMPIEHEAEALRIYDVLFGTLPLDSWQRQGTLLTRLANGRKLNFAARRSHCTIGFRGHAAIEFYRFLGGDCPVGEVTIKPPYDQDWDPAPIRETIIWYFNN